MINRVELKRNVFVSLECLGLVYERLSGECDLEQRHGGTLLIAHSHSIEDKKRKKEKSHSKFQ